MCCVCTREVCLEKSKYSVCSDDGDDDDDDVVRRHDVTDAGESNQLHTFPRRSFLISTCS